MEYINEVTLCGRVSNAQTFKADAVREVTRFIMSTECVIKTDNGGIVDITWHEVLSLNKVDIAKGDWVKVKGKLRTMRIVDSNNNDRYAVQVVASSVEKVEDNAK